MQPENRNGQQREKGEIRGVLAIWNDLDPKNESDYHEWYFKEHLFERLGIPGFLTARRYESTGRGPKYFTFYHTTSVEVLRTPVYLQRINNPTDWTRRNMAWFKNMNRTACRETLDQGRGIGCAALTLEIKPISGREEELRRRISESLFPDLLGSPGATGIIRAHLWEGDPEITIQRTNELALRGGRDQMVYWVMVVEASSLTQAENAGKLLTDYTLKAWGAESVGSPYIYRLLHHVQGPDGR
ncbi:MAG: hypothetical protein QME78_01055 [Thermodesulfobacteriota bacterium]|nr:hypothetical protein [Thermodesulfobacteriota bacterium]